MPKLIEILGGPVLGQPDGSPLEYHRIAILRYANAADLQESVASEIGQQAFADVANFATGGMTVFLTSLESAIPPAWRPRRWDSGLKYLRNSIVPPSAPAVISMTAGAIRVVGRIHIYASGYCPGM